MGVVDVHQHLLPPGFVEALRDRDAVPFMRGCTLHVPEGAYEIEVVSDELEARLRLLDDAGIDVALVSLQPTFWPADIAPDDRDQLERVWEDGILELAAGSDGRIVPVAASRPRDGFAGVAVGASALDDMDAIGPVLDSLRGSQFLFVHPAAAAPRPDAPAWWPALVDYTAQMQRAYFAWLAHGQARWPDVRVVFAILAGGAPVQLERLESRGVDVRSVLHQNLFFDTSSYGRRALEICVETFGVGQLVHGSDAPVIHPRVTLRAIEGFGESVEKLVTYDNPNRLLT